MQVLILSLETVSELFDTLSIPSTSVPKLSACTRSCAVQGAQGSCHTLQMSDAVPAAQGTVSLSLPGLCFWQFVLMFPK